MSLYCCEHADESHTHEEYTMRDRFYGEVEYASCVCSECEDRLVCSRSGYVDDTGVFHSLIPIPGTVAEFYAASRFSRR